MNLILNKNSLCIAAAILCLQTAVAQTYFSAQEYGVSLGASQYFGDLNTNYGFKHIRPAIGVVYKQHLNPYISITGNLAGTQVGYDDAWSDNIFERTRNLNFKSYIVELAAMGEFNFFWFETGNRNRRYTPYVTLGISAFYSNPYTFLDGKRYALRSVGTEGQNTEEYKGRKYSNFNLAFPIGAGIKTWIRPGLNLAFEIANRFTATDYLDDVSRTYVGGDNFGGPQINSSSYQLQDRSINKELGLKDQQRGDQISFDQFLMVQLKLTFQLKTYKCPSYQNGLWEP